MKNRLPSGIKEIDKGYSIDSKKMFSLSFKKILVGIILLILAGIFSFTPLGGLFILMFIIYIIYLVVVGFLGYFNFIRMISKYRSSNIAEVKFKK